MRIIRFSIVIIMILTISSCSEMISSNDVSPEKTLRSYSAYCTNGGTTYITAEFFAKAGLTIPPFREPFGKNITLEPPSTVHFNGKEMEADKGIFGDITYKTRVNGWPSGFRWDWKDKNGKNYSDSATMDTIKLGNDYLMSGGKDYAVTWIGSPIQRGEEIAVTIEADEYEFYETSEQAGAGNIEIKGSGNILDPYGSYTTGISRTLRVRKVREISVENVAGSFIKLIYQYNE